MQHQLTSEVRVPTMAEVARVAGVSISTVSHVINGTRAVADETRERVREAIERTGYRQNAIARALATHSTGAIGLGISVLTNTYFGELVHVIEAEARANGLTLVLGDTHDDARVEAEVVDQLISRQIDGLLLAPSAHAAEVTLPRLIEAGVPFVLLDRAADVECDQVLPDGVEPTRRLVSHLAGLGHRRIGMVSGLNGLSTTNDRIAGYKQAVAQFGLDDDPSLIAEGASDAAVAYQQVTALFSGPTAPTGLLVANNAMTIGTLRALRDLGLAVPRDVALVCYDDFEWADLFEPRLTCMAQDCEAMGRKAIELLLARIKGDESPARRYWIPTQFHHRSSCGC